MKPVIEELYKKTIGKDWAYDFDPAIAEKFAELIVSECVQVCVDRGKMHDGLYSSWAVDCSQRIEKHFGVTQL